MRLACHRNDVRQAGLARLRCSPRPARRCSAPAVVIAAFGPKEGSPGLPTTPHLIAAGQSATKAPQDGETVAIRSDPDVTPLKVIPPVEFVGSEQRRINFDAGSSPVPLSSTAPAGAAQPAPGVFAGLSRRSRRARSPPISPRHRRFPAPNLVRTASTPPDPTAAPAATNAGEAAHQTDELQRPAETRPSSESKAATAARPTTLKLDPAARHSPAERPPARSWPGPAWPRPARPRRSGASRCVPWLGRAPGAPGGPPAAAEPPDSPASRRPGASQSCDACRRRASPARSGRRRS